MSIRHRHDYVADDYKLMTLADLLPDFERTTLRKDDSIKKRRVPHFSRSLREVGFFSDFETTTRGRDRESAVPREGDGVDNNLW